MLFLVGPCYIIQTFKEHFDMSPRLKGIFLPRQPKAAYVDVCVCGLREGRFSDMMWEAKSLY